VIAEAAPFALEAKHFVEVRLLNRNVALRVGGVDKFGNLYGVVEHSAGSISVELLKAGLAKMVDWSACECV
jgi:staphylococcal nuclease domain-containing protein 1